MKIKSVLVSLFAMVSFSACSDARIDALERQTKSDMADLRSIQAEQTVALNQVRTEVNGLRGQLEELGHTSSGKTQELERTLQQLNTRVPPPAGVPEELLSRDEERIATVSGPAAEKFKMGLQQVRTGQFEGARATFTAFVQENPGTAFTDNGLFWQGIAYSKLGQYDRAVVAFSDVFQSYPAEDMVPPALYFLADCFEKAGAAEDAQLTLQKLVDEHPRSPYAMQAKSRLQVKRKPAPKRR